ncbi:hypothetical protein D3C72_2241530 [compost metagenome]
MHFVRRCAIADLRDIPQERLGQGSVAQHLLEGQFGRRVADHRTASQNIACGQAHPNGTTAFNQDLVHLRIASDLHPVFGSGAQYRLRDGTHAAAYDAGAPGRRRVVAQESA